MTPHPSTLAWQIPWTEEPGGLQSMGSLRVGHDWATSFSLFHALEKEMATHCSILAWRIPGMGEPGGLSSMGSHRVGHDWSNLAAQRMKILETICVLTEETYILPGHWLYLLIPLRRSTSFMPSPVNPLPATLGKDLFIGTTISQQPYIESSNLRVPTLLGTS